MSSYGSKCTTGYALEEPSVPFFDFKENNPFQRSEKKKKEIIIIILINRTFEENFSKVCVTTLFIQMILISSQVFILS